MDTLVFFAVLAVFAIPLVLLGWWLKRNTRSVDRLAAVINEHGVTFGEIRIGNKAHGWLLFADVRFVFFVILRRYRDMELPEPVLDALNSARSDYLNGVAVFTTLVALASAWAFYSSL